MTTYRPAACDTSRHVSILRAVDRMRYEFEAMLLLVPSGTAAGPARDASRPPCRRTHTGSRRRTPWSPPACRRGEPEARLRCRIGRGSDVHPMLPSRARNSPPAVTTCSTSTGASAGGTGRRYRGKRRLSRSVHAMRQASRDRLSAESSRPCEPLRPSVMRVTAMVGLAGFHPAKRGCWPIART